MFGSGLLLSMMVLAVAGLALVAMYPWMALFLALGAGLVCCCKDQ